MPRITLPLCVTTVSPVVTLPSVSPWNTCIIPSDTRMVAETVSETCILPHLRVTGGEDSRFFWGDDFVGLREKMQVFVSLRDNVVKSPAG